MIQLETIVSRSHTIGLVANAAPGAIVIRSTMFEITDAVAAFQILVERDFRSGKAVSIRLTVSHASRAEDVTRQVFRATRAVKRTVISFPARFRFAFSVKIKVTNLSGITILVLATFAAFTIGAL